MPRTSPKLVQASGKSLTPANANGQKARFVALARVSSREQEREGFSLDVQVDDRSDFFKSEGVKPNLERAVVEAAENVQDSALLRTLTIEFWPAP